MRARKSTYIIYFKCLPSSNLGIERNSYKKSAVFNASPPLRSFVLYSVSDGVFVRGQELFLGCVVIRLLFAYGPPFELLLDIVANHPVQYEL